MVIDPRKVVCQHLVPVRMEKPLGMTTASTWETADCNLAAMAQDVLKRGFVFSIGQPSLNKITMRVTDPDPGGADIASATVDNTAHSNDSAMEGLIMEAHAALAKVVA